MARKREPKMPAVKQKKALVPMRFMISVEVDRKLERRTDELGLSKSSYAKMIIIERIKADDERGSK
jgi:hypothetical protein